MPKRLKSNFKYVWDNMMYGIFFLICVIPCLRHIGSEMSQVKQWFLLFFVLFSAGCCIGFSLNFLRKWQWIIIEKDQIVARCPLGVVHSIPLTNVKRCWTCYTEMMIQANWALRRDCIVIDTIRSRGAHTVIDGYCRKKQKYIILPDTAENRAALREYGIVVEFP